MRFNLCDFLDGLMVITKAKTHAEIHSKGQKNNRFDTKYFSLTPSNNNIFHHTTFQAIYNYIFQTNNLEYNKYFSESRMSLDKTLSKHGQKVVIESTPY